MIKNKTFLFIKWQKSIFTQRSHVLLRNLSYTGHSSMYYNQGHHLNSLICYFSCQEFHLSLKKIVQGMQKPASETFHWRTACLPWEQNLLQSVEVKRQNRLLKSKKMVSSAKEKENS